MKVVDLPRDTAGIWNCESKQVLAMHKLSAQDATWLYLESPSMMFHIGALQLFKAPPGGAREFHARYIKRLHERRDIAAPFQWHLTNTPWNLDHPAWVDMDDVSFEDHVHMASLPLPGTQKQLSDLCGQLQSQPLDRSKPMFEYHVIDGLESGLVGLFAKLHHCYIDGAMGTLLTMAMYDGADSVVSEMMGKPAPRDDREPDAVDMLTDAVAHFLELPFKASADTVSLVNAGTKLVRHWFGNPDKRTPLPFTAPRTPLNVNVSNERIFSMFSWPLDDIKLIKKETGTTINDVVLAACAGGLRHYLKEKKALPAKSLVTAVPVSLREKNDASYANRISVMLTSLHTDTTNSLVRLYRIHDSARLAKENAALTKDAFSGDLSIPGLPLIIAGAGRIFEASHLAEQMPPAFNVLISNVPTAPFPLHLDGCEMVGNYPVSAIGHSCALNITVQSYNGGMDFGLIACKKALPDVERLSALIRRELKILYHGVLREEIDPATEDTAPRDIRVLPHAPAPPAEIQRDKIN